MSAAHRFQLGDRLGKYLSGFNNPFIKGFLGHDWPSRKRPKHEEMDAAKARQLMLEKHNTMIKALTDLSNMRAKLIVAQKELSTLKRGAEE